MESYLSTLINESIAKLEQEKERLIKLRIEERVKENIDIIKEAQKRFPRILREFNRIDQSEHWYWNDGSIDGLHLISFYCSETNFFDLNNKIEIGFDYL